jgi:hypothetical protein
MSLLLFVDESGSDHKSLPYEVLAGIALKDDRLWPFVQAIEAIQQEEFGALLSELGLEFKAERILKRKMFRFARQGPPLPPDERQALAASFLRKGYLAERDRVTITGQTSREFTAYGQACQAAMHRVLDACASFEARVFASIVDLAAPGLEDPRADFLRKDYVYFFERYFYYLETFPRGVLGLVIFDELEKAKARIRLDQMARYFRRTEKGRTRSDRIVPAAFFVHSDLTTIIQVADLLAYCINWAYRWPGGASKPTRQDLDEYASKIAGLRFQGDAPDESGAGARRISGITYLDDLRGGGGRGP